MRTPTARLLEAVCDALVAEIAPGAAPATRDACRRLVAAFHAEMQPAWRLALAVLGAWLELACLAAAGRRFTRADPAARAAALARWRGSRLGPKRAFVRLLLVLTLIALHDAEETTARLGLDRAAYASALAFYRGGPA